MPVPVTASSAAPTPEKAAAYELGKAGYDCVILAVKDRPGGRTIVEKGDFCIAAMPPHILARIPHNLGADVTAALSEPQPTPVGKIDLEYRRRWWEQDFRMYGGITETDMDLDHVWYPSYDFHGRRGVVVGYYNTGADATTYGALTPAGRLRRAVAQGVKIHGDLYRRELSSAFSAAFDVGRALPGDWIAWQDGAFISARQVVGELHQRATATS